ncbi:MAG: AAA family ATPase [Clostridiales bacterium]|nr:AAA family ATPase [Clostridiales bacterium]
MSLNAETQNLIRFVAENNIHEARKWAVLALDTDTTQKNRYFINKYKSILTSEGTNMVELPHDLKEIMLYEDVSRSFIAGRYYLTWQTEEIVEKISQMAAVSRKLMEMRVPYKNATLLYGPPGTGKTMLGRYVAYRTGLPFCYLNFSRVVDSYMGATSKNIAKAFSYASANPCVFMLDEVDTISINRSGNPNDGSGKEIARVTVTLMQEFDKLPNDVILVAATNRLDLLDEAFISRCSLKYEMQPFTEEQNRGMVMKFLADTGVELSSAEIGGIIQGGDQREVMNRLVQAVAEKLAVEPDTEGGI